MRGWDALVEGSETPYVTDPETGEPTARHVMRIEFNATPFEAEEWARRMSERPNARVWIHAIALEES